MAPRLRVTDAVAVAVPTALLLAVATTQVWLSTTSRLSPWKGGGFGMFASVDGLAFRTVRITVSAPERSEELHVPASLDDLAARTATFPHDAAMERLGRAVGARERRQGRPVQNVTIDVWRAAYSPSLDAQWTKLASRTVVVDADRPDDR